VSGMSTEQTADQQIAEVVTAWPGVQSGLGSRGELGFRVGRREIGHLHGDRVAHFGFPRATWDRLLGDGIVEPHPIDKPGWAARRITGPEDVAIVVTLMRLNYDRAVARHGVPEPA
jgi:hypothetical protein